MHSFYLDAIRNFEGYTPQATPDYAQLSNGYGTRARFAGEVISKAEAERRFQTEVAAARSIVEKAAPNADEGTKAALTSLTYNAGSSWVESGLGDAVRSGNLDQVRDIFQKYTKAGGEVLPGLVSRRSQEAMWIGNPDMVMAGAGTAGGSEGGGAVLPPIIPQRDASALRLAEMLEQRPIDGAASFAQAPRTAGSGQQAALSPDALLALSDATRLSTGSVADMTRLIRLGNGSTLATSSDRQREHNETRRA